MLQVGLLVTYVDPNGAGWWQNVRRGDLLYARDGEGVPLGTYDADFAREIQALGRSVELSFSRQVSRSSNSLEDVLDDMGPT